MITINGISFIHSDDKFIPPITNTVVLEVETCERRPLWFHKRNLMQTATGFGRKLKTEYMIKISKRWYRVFCCQISNSGSTYIVKGGKNVYIDLDDVVIN